MYKEKLIHLLIDDQCKEKAMAYFGSLTRNAHFGNVRVVENDLLPMLKRNRDRRYRDASDEEKKNPDFMKRIIPEDFTDRKGWNDGS